MYERAFSSPLNKSSINIAGNITTGPVVDGRDYVTYLERCISHVKIVDCEVTARCCVGR